jgi:hypothetical protein
VYGVQESRVLRNHIRQSNSCIRSAPGISIVWRCKAKKAKEQRTSMIDGQRSLTH